MSISEGMLDLDKPSDSSPDAFQPTSDPIDIEMMLTPVDDDSSKSIDDMSSRFAKEERGPRQGQNGNANNGVRTNGSWRREEGARPPTPEEEGEVDVVVPITTIHPGPVWPSPAQLNSAYGYALDRGNGQYTRLIPADTLPYNEYPKYQTTEGLIILPMPRHEQPVPNRAPAMVAQSYVNMLPPLPFRNGGSPPDAVQRHIDTVVQRNTPKEVQYPVFPPPTSYPDYMSAPPSGGSSTRAIIPFPTRKDKIYCDKWVHDGTCAFTQVGCKYKHEMPMDKATQLSLGLNHGFPNWYKRQHGMQMNQQAQAQGQLTITHRGGRAGNGGTNRTGDWRSRESMGALPAPSTQSNNTSDIRGNGSSGREVNPLGPIGPPSGRRRRGGNNDNQFSNENGNGCGNSYTSLQNSADTGDDEEGEISFTGRRKNNSNSCSRKQ